jgi:hypothetical protein
MEIYLFTLNLIKFIVMSLLDKIKTNKTQNESSLNKEELELILTLIKNSSFKGKDVETLYNSVYKLQQQYLLITQ